MFYSVIWVVTSQAWLPGATTQTIEIWTFTAMIIPSQNCCFVYFACIWILPPFIALHIPGCHIYVIQIIVFRDVITCSVVDGYQCLGGTCSLCFQNRRLWWWRQKFAPKDWYLFTILRFVTSQEILILVITATCSDHRYSYLVSNDLFFHATSKYFKEN
jgi:hypothetical protein